MKLLLLLLSVMTFTVQTKNSVLAEGSFPYDMEVDYACNYQKGTVRNGDTATLTLSNLGNIGLESVQIYLRSNTSSGAGKLTIMADNTSLMGKTGTYQSWFGAYDNTNYHPIGWTGNYRLENGRLQIRLVGTVNSLYIEKYEIQPLPLGFIVLAKFTQYCCISSLTFFSCEYLSALVSKEPFR